MGAINSVQSRNVDRIEVDDLSICQTLWLLIQKVKDAIVEGFFYCWTAIQNAYFYLTGTGPLTEAQKTEYVQSILLILDQSGRQADVALGVSCRPHCQYPRWESRHGLCMCINLEQLRIEREQQEQRETRDQQILFEILPIDSQNFLNGLWPLDRAFILDAVVGRTAGAYGNTVHLMENDLFQFLSQLAPLNGLQFESREIDDAANGILRQNLSEPLRQRLNLFPPNMQSALLNSAYCQLKRQATGAGDVIYYP